MRRSLERAVKRAIYTTWNPHRANPRGSVTVVALFPDGAFPNAPQWSPGDGFTPCIDNASWMRENGDGTLTMTVTPVTPKEMPALDGGEWTEPEVWTVTVPQETDHLGFLWDKPHRVTWLRDEPQAVVRREPYAGHPSKDVHDYWDRFRADWGFTPRENYHYGRPYGRLWVALACNPGWEGEPNENDLVHFSLVLHREFGAKLRVYPYSHRLRSTTDPFRGGHDSLWEMVAAASADHCTDI